jgi:hypothetical protein
MGLYFGTARLFQGNKTMLDNASFTQRLLEREMMMYFGSMYIQLIIRLMQQTTQA